jgi:RNA polymerase sigma-70 factor (ECF subfamily)
MGVPNMQMMGYGKSADVQDESRVQTLLEDARMGSNEAALGALLEFYRPLLERLSSRRVGRRLAAKVTCSEVAQITLISAAERFGDFRGETVEQFRAWLCVILQNEITDHSRRFLISQCRTMSRETSLTRDIVQPSSQRPSQICSAQEQVARLLQAVESLPDELCAIVRMRYQQNMTFSEIASSLGLPPATARRRWLQAVEQIEQMML